MECSICYEQFFIIKTDEEKKEMKERMLKIREEKDYKKMMDLMNLTITPSYNKTYSCYTPECDVVICYNCMSNLLPIYGFKYVCTHCRQIDWRICWSYGVLPEYMIKVLGEQDGLEYIKKMKFYIK